MAPSDMALRRRTLLLSAVASVAAPATVVGLDDLEIYFRDDAVRDVLVIRLNKTEVVWHRQMFGERAWFKLRRQSRERYVPPHDEKGPELRWEPASWQLQVLSAGFPGGAAHTLTFAFERAQRSGRAQFGPWMASLGIVGWPLPSQRWNTAAPVSLEGFLAGTAALAWEMPRSAAQAALEQWFGKRVETSSALTVSFRKTGAWQATASSGQLYILDAAAPQASSPFGFATLEVVRVFGADAPPELPRVVPSLPAFLTRYAPPDRADGSVPVGLQGRLDNPMAPRNKTFELGAGPSRAVRLELTLNDREGLQGAVRHWGEPAFAVAGAWLTGPDRQRALLSLAATGQQPTAQFQIAALEIARRLGRDGKVHTATSLYACEKPFAVETAFGRVVVGAAPAVGERTGALARVPPIVVKTEDLPDVKDRRLLRGFDGVLSLTSLAVRLPTFSAPEQADEPHHVARLDFADAACRFAIPALTGQPAVAADVLVPLGPGPGESALFDLGRATLTVLRPTDMLSLKYRFSGLLLEVPPAGSSKVARVLPSRGGPVCRGANGSDEQDLRPIMVVEFPPQHVAEQAYYRQLPPLDLPVIVQPSDAQLALLAELRRAQPRGRETDDEDRRVARTNLRARFRQTAPRFSGQAAVDQFETLAAGTLRQPALPAEQRIYVAPDLLDDAGRRLMLDVLRQLAKGKAAGPPVYDLALEPDVEETALRPFKLLPSRSKDEGQKLDASLPSHEPALLALEAEKERRSADYGDFRRAFASKFGLAYLGPDWLAARHPEWHAWAEAWRPPLEEVGRTTPARLSGPSRLAFRVNCDDFQAERRGGGMAFSLEALTDWGSMDLAVVRRAERLFQPAARGPAPPRWARVGSADDAQILLHQSISRGDHVAVAVDRQLRGGEPARPGRDEISYPGRVDPFTRLAEIVAATKDRPDPFQTAIELPFRLFLSPAQDATWRVPSEAVRLKAFSRVPGGPAPQGERWNELWSASLAGTGVQAGVRAIWSPDYRPAALLSTRGAGAPANGPWAPWSMPKAAGIRGAFAREKLPRFRTGLDAYDRHELVILSSVYGLPVLGRRGADKKLIGASQFEPPDGFKLDGLQIDAPKPDAAGKQPLPPGDYSAIYRPQPLSVTELTLTALGGSLDHDTAFTPPASAQLDGAVNLFDAMSISRWRNRTVLGRDILVEVAYKGFLFPIGHKATMVKLTERRFEQSPAGGGPVAVLIQRQFLRVGDPVKVFPAYGHPNAARRWPATQVEMLTRRTPDLVEPTTAANGKIDLPGGTGLVFWPRVAANADVQFEMRIDSEGASGSMPLIFVNNVAAHDVPTMLALADQYRKLDEGKRRLPRNGQPVRMAPSEKTGDTTFETDWWQLVAEGRSEEAPTPAPRSSGGFTIRNDEFRMDPFMEGLDQPGFYPMVERARIRLSQVERMTGRPTVWSEASYDGHYVANGFCAEGKVSDDTFLQIVGEPVPMRMAGSDRSGGIGQPDTNVVGLSRGLGPVGSDSPAPMVYPPRPDSSPHDVSSISVHTGGLTAKTLFPRGAKLLGLLELSEVVTLAAELAGQPRLQELTEYGASQSAGARAFLREGVLVPMQTAIATLVQQWQEAALKVREAAHLDLLRDFPQIGTALRELRDAVTASLAEGLSDAAFFASLASIYEAGRRLIAAVEQTLRDPLASFSGAQTLALRDLTAKAKSLREAIADPRGAATAALGAAQDQILAALLDDETLRLFFVLPMPEPGADAGAADARRIGELRTAVRQAIASGDLAPVTTASLVTARFETIRPAISGAVAHWAGLTRALGAGDTIGGAQALGQLLQDASMALGSPIALPGLERACSRLSDLAGLVGRAATVLIPAEPGAPAEFDVWERHFRQGSPPSGATTGTPGPGDRFAAAALLASLAGVADALAVLASDLPAGDVRSDVEALRKALVAGSAELAGALAALTRARALLAAAPVRTDCQVPGPVLSAMVALDAARRTAWNALRERAGELARLAGLLARADGLAADAGRYSKEFRQAIQDASTAAAARARVAGLQAVRFSRAFSLIATTNTAEVDGVDAARRTALGAVLDQLASVAESAPPGAQTPIRTVVEQLRGSAPTLAICEAATRRAADKLRGAEAGALDAADEAIAKTAGEVEAKLGAVLCDLVERLGPSVVDLADRFETKALAALRGAAARLDGALSAIDGARTAMQKVLKDGQGGALLKAWLAAVEARLATTLLTVSAPDEAPPGTDGLGYEIDLVRTASNAATPAPAALEALRHLAAAWAAPGPAVLRLAAQLTRLDGEFARTLLLPSLDLGALRRTVDGAIRQLIPSRVTLKYDLDTELKDFPSGTPIFKPDRGTKLTIRAATVLDLLHPGKGPTLGVTGEIGPFQIKLLGDLDVVTLLFDGVGFKSGSGMSPDFQVRFRDVLMGEQAKFLQTVQSYLSPKGGGFYISFPPGRRGIEAGYGINLGVIGVGYLSFSNIVLNAAVRLPFDNSPANFVVSIGRSDAPFLISSTVFGGGGYLGLVSAADRFVGFEASFDFGGVLAFGFGPLTGIGRVTMGVYVRLEGTQSAVGATFFVGGAAHIACFALSTSMMIRLTQEPGGEMEGTATFSFSFSLGITDVTFTVVAHKSAGASMGSKTDKTARLEGSRTMFAALPASTLTDACQDAAAAQATSVTPQRVSGPRAVGVSVAEDWKRHRDYFDTGLRPAKSWRPL